MEEIEKRKVLLCNILKKFRIRNHQYYEVFTVKGVYPKYRLEISRSARDNRVKQCV